MASVFPAPVSALQVGSYFVQQYYQVLQTQPDFVHQFYTDASNMTRIDGDSSESATAMMQIHTLIMSLNFTGIEIKTAHSLDSWNGGVLVMVTGSVVTDYRRRKFIQTFFLAPQEKGYFVLNDIFQFVEEEQTHQHQAAILTQSPYDSAVNISNPLLEPEPEPVPEYVPAVETQAREFVVSPHVEESEPVEYSVPEQQYQFQAPEVNNSVEEPHVEEYSLPESTASFSHAVNPVQEAAPVPIEEPVGEPQKHTYASILRVAKGPATSTLPPPQRYVAPKVEPPKSEWNHTPEPAQQFYSATAYGSDRSTTEPTEELATHDEGEGRSVYVKNLSTTVTALDIEEEFKNFGIIKPDGVVVRNRKDVGGVCYAFVEFEDVDGAQNAIKASPVQINGRQVYIEERKPNPNGYSASRGRGRGRGRGGYSTESTRGGRYGGRGYGGRGSSGEGYDNREYTNNSRPSRGNGYVRRGPSQERGILGNGA